MQGIGVLKSIMRECVQMIRPIYPVRSLGILLLRGVTGLAGWRDGPFFRRDGGVGINFRRDGRMAGFELKAGSDITNLFQRDGGISLFWRDGGIGI